MYGCRKQNQQPLKRCQSQSKEVYGFKSSASFYLQLLLFFQLIYFDRQHLVGFGRCCDKIAVFYIQFTLFCIFISAKFTLLNVDDVVGLANLYALTIFWPACRDSRWWIYHVLIICYLFIYLFLFYNSIHILFFGIFFFLNFFYVVIMIWFSCEHFAYRWICLILNTTFLSQRDIGPWKLFRVFSANCISFVACHFSLFMVLFD